MNQPSPSFIRLVEPVSTRGLVVSRPGPRPDLRWIPLDQLVVASSYQREMSERSISMVRRAAAEFSWRRVKPLNVIAREDGRFEVLDGQHTAAILAAVGAVEAPCLVESPAAEAVLAGDFVAINSNRLSVTPMQKFRAALTAGDARALAVRDAAAATGARILPRPPQKGKYRPGDTVAVAAMQAIAGRRAEKGLTRILGACVAGGLAPIGTEALRAVEVLLFDESYAGEIQSGAIAKALADGFERLRDEADLARLDSGEPLYRQLAVEIFRRVG